MNIPLIETTVRVYNPAYDRNDPNSEFMIFVRREVEVVQLNLSSGGMRVRFKDSNQGKVVTSTQDVSIKDFFAQYEIVPKI